jgi:glycerol kinase
MLKANIERMLSAGFSIRQLQVGGGMTRVDSVCQLLADLTRIVVYRPAEVEATARGIAWLAAARPAHWPKPGRGEFFRPLSNPGLDKRYGIFRRILK